jgi:adenosylhomocysteine nucleosidase
MSFDEHARSGGAVQLGFVAALGVECASLLARAPRPGTWLVVQSGPGAQRAASAAARAIAGGAGALVSWGLAGGLHARLAPGTVVAPRRVLEQGGAAWPSDAAWRSRLAGAAEGLVFDYGDLLSVPAALESPAQKRAAAVATGAVAVDMESAAIAAVAARARVPFVALRVIVDAVDDALPPGAEHWIDEHGNRRAAAALRAAASFRQWRPLLTLAKRYRVASAALDRLAQALARLPAGDGRVRRAGS